MDPVLMIILEERLERMPHWRQTLVVAEHMLRRTVFGFEAANRWLVEKLMED